MNAYAYNGQAITPVVEIYHDVIPYLGNITEKEFYTDTENASPHGSRPHFSWRCCI